MNFLRKEHPERNQKDRDRALHERQLDRATAIKLDDLAHDKQDNARRQRQEARDSARGGGIQLPERPKPRRLAPKLGAVFAAFALSIGTSGGKDNQEKSQRVSGDSGEAAKVLSEGYHRAIMTKVLGPLSVAQAAKDGANTEVPTSSGQASAVETITSGNGQERPKAWDASASVLQAPEPDSEDWGNNLDNSNGTGGAAVTSRTDQGGAAAPQAEQTGGFNDSSHADQGSVTTNQLGANPVPSPKLENGILGTNDDLNQSGGAPSEPATMSGGVVSPPPYGS